MKLDGTSNVSQYPLWKGASCSRDEVNCISWLCDVEPVRVMVTADDVPESGAFAVNTEIV